MGSSMVNGSTAVRGVETGAPALGAIAGLMLIDHHGVPVWFLVLALTISLGFGMWSAAIRPRDPNERAERARIAKGNAGALWVMACTSVWLGDLGLPGAMMTALVLGLLGTRALESVEKRWLDTMGGPQ